MNYPVVNLIIFFMKLSDAIRLIKQLFIKHHSTQRLENNEKKRAKTKLIYFQANILVLNNDLKLD